MSLYLVHWTYPAMPPHLRSEWCVVTSLKEARRLAREETDIGDGDRVEILRVVDAVAVPVPRSVSVVAGDAA